MQKRSAGAVQSLPSAEKLSISLRIFLAWPPAKRCQVRGGMTFRVFHVTCAESSHPDKVAITNYKNARRQAEQYLVEPAS
jgi:hypothetical protein